MTLSLNKQRNKNRDRENVCPNGAEEKENEEFDSKINCALANEIDSVQFLS